MKRLMLVGALSAVFALPALSVEYRQLTAEEEKLIEAKYQSLSDADKAKRKVAIQIRNLHKHGGRMTLPGTPKGSIRIVNLQKKVPSSELKGVTDAFQSLEPFDIKLVDADCAANLKITIVDDAKAPSLALYPDEGRAIVNAAKLADEKTAAKPQFLASRIRKEILRAFAFMTAGSTYGTAIFNPMKAPKDLDDCAGDSMPMDVIMRSSKFLREMGIVPEERLTYKLVLQRGFDIAPTNEYQRVIYEQVKKEKAEKDKKSGK